MNTLNSRYDAEETAIAAETVDDAADRVRGPVMRALETLPVLWRKAVTAYYRIPCSPPAPKEIGREAPMDDNMSVNEVRRAVRRLRHPSASQWLREALRVGENEVWLRIMNPQGIVYKRDYPADVLPRISGEMRLAIACFYEAVADWLSATGRETTVAWVRSAFTEGEIRAAAERVRLLWKRASLVVSVERLAKEFDTDEQLLRTAIALDGKFQTYMGYLVRRPRSRTMRAVRLHRLIADVWGGGPAPESEILETYRGRYSDDTCKRVDLETSMIENPNLFLDLGTLGWCGVGPAATLSRAEDRETRLPLLLSAGFGDNSFFQWSAERKSASDPVGELVASLLVEMAPCSFEALARTFNARHPSRAASSGNLLNLSREHWIRLAPGIYGVRGRDENLALTPAVRDLLLTRASCSTYLIVVHFSEGLVRYPLWSPAAEKEWCVWGETQLPKPLFDSLLAVAQPDLWPATDQEKALWNWKKECRGRFRFRPELRYSLAERPPNLLDVYRLLRVVCVRRRLNWVQANAILGATRPTGRASLSALALLAGFNALTLPADWTGYGLAGPAAEMWNARFTAELHRNGRLAWNKGSGAEALASAKFPGGWANSGEFLHLVEFVRDGSFNATDRTARPVIAQPVSYLEDAPTEQKSLWR